MDNLSFPSEFLFGAATAAHQVEGGLTNDWTAWEKENAERNAKRMHGWRLPKHIRNAHPSPFDPTSHISGRAADHYARYKEDIALAASLGHTAHRFSIAWSRVEPIGGEFDSNALDHYRSVVEAIRQHDMEPMVTLWHFTLPQWFADKGGFLHQEAPDIFARYCSKVAAHIGDIASLFLTINEPTIFAAQGYLKGQWPPQEHSPLAYMRVQKNLIRAHNKAYQAIKNIAPQCKIGYAKNCISADGFWGNIKKTFWNERFIRATKRFSDIIGINYYFHTFASDKKRKAAAMSDMGWRIYSAGLYQVLMSLRKYKKPLYITENGLADRRDALRTDFIRDHLQEVSRAAQHGADVRGYFYWSLLDNFEWDKGFWPRFGLIEVDYKTQKRTPRASAYAYKDIIEGSRRT